jgi:hypothetical protein
MSSPTKHGQTEAVAVEVAAALNAASATFILPVSAVVLHARKLGIGDINKIGSAVTVQVFPGDLLADLMGLSRMYDDTYGCHVLLLQNVVDDTNGGLSETQVALLVRLHSEIIEFLGSRSLSCPNAVHPFFGAVAKAFRQGHEGVNDLLRLEGENLFYSDLIVTYHTAGLRRKV